MYGTAGCLCNGWEAGVHSFEEQCGTVGMLSARTFGLSHPITKEPIGVFPKFTMKDMLYEMLCVVVLV